MLKQSLDQKLLQKLSPQQIQMIKLLEIPTLQLEQRIKHEIEENPVLEEGENQEASENDYDSEEEQNTSGEDEFSFDDYLNDEDTPTYKLYAKNSSKDDKHEEIPYRVSTSLHEHLESQIGLKSLSDREYFFATYLIGNIDDDGYLRRKLESIVNDLAFTQNIKTTEEELEDVL
ncbi:MAG: RNA polymerase factor sigma-54, partial [Bacteroidota bacterium]